MSTIEEKTQILHDAPAVGVQRTCSAIDADWRVELNADCPTCGEHVNLLDAPDFWDGRKLEIAEHDTKESDNLEVQCPKCYHQFTVRCRW